MDELLNKIISKLELFLQTKSVLHTPIDGLALYKKACNDNILMGPDDILISLIFSGKKVIYVGEKDMNKQRVNAFIVELIRQLYFTVLMKVRAKHFS